MTANRGRWAWAAVSTLGYVASGFGGFVGAWVLEASGLLVVSGLDAHGLGLTSQAVIWGILSVFVVVVAARLLLDARLRISSGAIAVLGAGLVIAALAQYLLYDYAEARLGYFAWQSIGWTIALPGAVVAVAVASFAAWAAPRPAVALPALIALALAAAGVGFIVLSNLDGLADGIRPASIPLAIMVGVAGVFTFGVAAITFERRLRVASAGAGNRPSG
jgi:hypothetical protein